MSDAQFGPDAQPAAMPAMLDALALRAIAKAAQAGPDEALAWARTAREALEALRIAPTEPVGDAGASPVIAALEAELRAASQLVVIQRVELRSLREFLGDLFRTFDEAGTETATRIAQRIERQLARDWGEVQADEQPPADA